MMTEKALASDSASSCELSQRPEGRYTGKHGVADQQPSKRKEGGHNG